MSSVNIIVAYNSKRVIGNNNQIPWHYHEDMQHFKECTLGCSVIMGRKTWDSLPDRFKPLPDRFNIVVTRQSNWASGSKSPDLVVSSIESAIQSAKDHIPNNPTWIIGGSEIYKYAIDYDLVDKIYASEIYGAQVGDAYFPEISPTKWTPTLLKHLDEFMIVKWTKR